MAKRESGRGEVSPQRGLIVTLAEGFIKNKSVLNLQYDRFKTSYPEADLLISRWEGGGRTPADEALADELRASLGKEGFKTFARALIDARNRFFADEEQKARASRPPTPKEVLAVRPRARTELDDAQMAPEPAQRQLGVDPRLYPAPKIERPAEDEGTIAEREMQLLIGEVINAYKRSNNQADFNRLVDLLMGGAGSAASSLGGNQAGHLLRALTRIENFREFSKTPGMVGGAETWQYINANSVAEFVKGYMKRGSKPLN